MLAVAGTPLKAPEGGAQLRQLGCDTRTDFGEVSTKCLSYADNQGASSVRCPATGMENNPLMPNLSPLDAYIHAVHGFLAGAIRGHGQRTRRGPPRRRDADELATRRSVLDFAQDGD